MEYIQTQAQEYLDYADINRAGETFRSNWSSYFRDFLGYPNGVITGATFTTGSSTSIQVSSGKVLISGLVCEISGALTTSVTGGSGTYRAYVQLSQVSDTLTTRTFITDPLSRTVYTSGVNKRDIDIVSLGFTTGALSSSQTQIGQFVWNGSAITSFDNTNRQVLSHLQQEISGFVATGMSFQTGQVTGILATATGTLNTKIDTTSGQVDYVSGQVGGKFQLVGHLAGTHIIAFVNGTQTETAFSSGFSGTGTLFIYLTAEENLLTASNCSVIIRDETAGLELKKISDGPKTATSTSVRRVTSASTSIPINGSKTVSIKVSTQSTTNYSGGFVYYTVTYLSR